MIEEALKEIIAAEAEAEQIIEDAHNKAAEISLATEELLNSRIAEKAEVLKKNLSEITKDAERRGTECRDKIFTETKSDATEIYAEAQKAFSDAADFVVKFIVGE